MRFLPFLTLSAYLATAACAQDAPPAARAPADPREILKKADAAARKVKLVFYVFKAEGVGALAARSPTMEGSATLGGDARSGAGPSKYRYETTIKQPGAKRSVKLTVGSDGKRHFLLDEQTRKVHGGADRAVIGKRGIAIVRFCGMFEFGHPAPFKDELNAHKVVLNGTEKIGDVECYRIAVIYARGQQETTWWLSTKSHLPRRVRRLQKLPGGQVGGTQLTLTQVAVNPSFFVDPFKLIVPKNYTETSEPAP